MRPLMRRAPSPGPQAPGPKPGATVRSPKPGGQGPRARAPSPGLGTTRTGEATTHGCLAPTRRGMVKRGNVPRAGYNAAIRTRAGPMTTHAGQVRSPNGSRRGRGPRVGGRGVGGRGRG